MPLDHICETNSFTKRGIARISGVDKAYTITIMKKKNGVFIVVTQLYFSKNILKKAGNSS